MDCLKAAEYLLTHDNILVVTHKNPDGDTLCSSAALCHALSRVGRTAWMFPNPQITDKYMPYVKAFIAPDGFKPSFIISVDVAADDMFARGFSPDHVDFCIDHHPTNKGFATENYICPEKSSCGEIILELIEEIDGEADSTEASLLYIAVSTDTGCFQYGNTSAETFEAAARLLRYGADSMAINVRFFRKVSSARIVLEGMIYSEMAFYRNGEVVVATITRDMMNRSGAKEDDCDDLAGLVGRVESEKLGITIRELENGSSKISVRSTPDIDSSAICAVFGGGGHRMASGCTIDASPEKARDLILSVVDEVWK